MDGTISPKELQTTSRVLRIRFHRTPAMARRTDPMRRAMADLWNDMVRVHKRIRSSRWKWPTLKDFDAHFVRRKYRYMGLPSACVQQAVRKFFGNLETTHQNRKQGRHARYPWRDQKRFATVIFRGNLVQWHNGTLTLGGGNGSPALEIPVRENPGTIQKAELLFDEVLITVEAPVPALRDAPVAIHIAAGDPGQRFAWTFLSDGGESLMINGRGIVAEKIRREKKRAHQKAVQSRRKPGSCRHKKTQWTMVRQQAKFKRRIRDKNHKITRPVVDWAVEKGVTKMVLSQPTGIAQAKGRKSQRQRNGYWEYGEQSRQIVYKAEGLFLVERSEERGTSSTCPRCGHRYHPSGRLFRCPNCSWTGHRDLVGAGNQLGRHVTHADVAALIEQARPKYLRPGQPGRSNVVETDRSRVPVSPPPVAHPIDNPRKWLAGDCGGRVAPVRRGREAAAQPFATRGKILELEPVTPRTPGF